MAEQLPLGRRGIANFLLAVVIALTVQTGFFHSCQHDGHDADIMVAEDHDSLHGEGEGSVCIACLLTRTLVASEPSHAPEPATSEGSEGAETAARQLSAASPAVAIAARAPPGC